MCTDNTIKVHPFSLLYLRKDMVKWSHVVIKSLHQTIRNRTIFIAIISAASSTIQTLDGFYGSIWKSASGLANFFSGQSAITLFSLAMTSLLTRITISVQYRLNKVLRLQSCNNNIETENLVQSIADSKINLVCHDHHPNKCWPSNTTVALFFLSGMAGAKCLQGLKSLVSP